MNGWIKLHRKMLDNPIANRPAWSWVWVTLLLMANHDETDSFIFNGKRMFLKAGQVLIGRKKLALQTGVPESTIEDILRYLETEQQIRQQKTTKYRVITIQNWKTHQDSDSKATTKRQPADTFKKLRSKEVNTNTIQEASFSQKIATPQDKAKWFFSTMETRPLPSDGVEYMQRFVEKTGISKGLAWFEVQKFVSYWTEKTKNGKKQLWETKKTFEVERRLNTWFQNVNERSGPARKGREILM